MTYIIKWPLDIFCPISPLPLDEGGFKMNKNQYLKRIEFILKALNEAPNGISVSDIHKQLVEEHHLDVSLKIVEEDILEIVKKGFFILDSKTPMTVYSSGIRECIIHLTNEEITYLLVVLPEGNPLRERLFSFMGIDRFYDEDPKQVQE
jgi:hypothetical protein